MNNSWVPFENDGVMPLPCAPKDRKSSINSVLRMWYSARWKIARPLLKRVPYTPVTFGELFIVFPLAAAFLAVAAERYSSDEISESGGPPTLMMGLAFFLACHNSIFTLITGIPFERAICYHKLAACLALIASILHGSAYMRVGPEDEETVFTLLGVGFTSVAVTGLLLTIVFALLILFSLPFVRRYLFEVFYRFHWILFTASIVLAFLHGAGGMFFGCIFWVIDIVYRYGYQALCFNSRKAKIFRLPADVIRIQFPKEDFNYKSGQYVFICIPQLSAFEWHTFSLSSAPHQKEVTLHVRALGNWTKRLYALAQTGVHDISILMEGPYGEPGVDVDGSTYKLFLLVSGGIGITPMQSIANDLRYQHSIGRPILKCWFVWAVRDRYMIDAVYDETDKKNRLPFSFSPDGLEELSSNRESPFYTEFYLTKIRDMAEFGQANIRPDLQECLRFERPDLSKITAEMADIAEKGQEKRVAVLVCGPDSMVQSVRKICSAASSSSVRFDVHSETFAL